MIEARNALGGNYGFLDETIGPIADEITAGLSAGVDFLRGLAGGEVVSPVGLYNDHKAIVSAEQDAWREAHPIARVGANVLGSMSAVPVAGGAALNALTLPQAIKQGAKVGGGIGAGIGAAEGDGALDRAENALANGALGAGLGAAMPLAINLGQRLVGAARRLTGLKGPAAERRAQEMVAEALRRDGIDPATLGNSSSGGKPLTIADLGPNTRDLIGSASRQGGRGKEAIEDFFENRTRDQFARISKDLADGTGMKGHEFAQTAADLVEARAKAAGPGYQAAYATPAPTLSGSAQGILATPNGKSAVATATRMMQNKRAPITDDAGNFTVEMLDQIQRAMRDSANRASGNRATEMAGNINTLRDQFLSEVPQELKSVMANYRSRSELLDAMRQGRDFFKGDVETLATSVRQMTPQQADMFRLGVARELRQRMGSKIDSGDMSGMFQNPQIRERLRTVFPSTRMFQEFVEKVGTERTMQETRNAILKGSQTAGRAAADAEFGAGALGEFATDMASGGGVSVGLTKAVTNAALRGKDRYLQGVNEAVAGNIADLAVNPSLGAVRQAISGPASTAVAFPVAPAAAPVTRGAIAAATAGGAPAAANSGWTIIKQ